MNVAPQFVVDGRIVDSDGCRRLFDIPLHRRIRVVPATLLTLLEVSGLGYAWHGYTSEEQAGLGNALSRAAPFLEPIPVLEAVKMAATSSRLV